MQKYSKIETIYQRDKETFKVTPLIKQQDPITALSLMRDVIIEEKINGTNAQMEFYFHPSVCSVPEVRFYSRNNEVTIEKDVMFIAETLTKVIDIEHLKKWYYANYCIDKDGKMKDGAVTIRIYGEVFGDKIQKNSYTGKGIRDFRVFDIQIGNFWLSPEARDNKCETLKLKSVPVIGTLIHFPPYEIIYDMLTRTHRQSLLADDYGREGDLEGYILRPQVSMYTNGGRVIGKIKRKDFTKNG